MRLQTVAVVVVAVLVAMTGPTYALTEAECAEKGYDSAVLQCSTCALLSDTLADEDAESKNVMADCLACCSGATQSDSPSPAESEGGAPTHVAGEIEVCS